jgi:hypothetical protein
VTPRHRRPATPLATTGPLFDGGEIITRVLRATWSDVGTKRELARRRAEKSTPGRRPKEFKPSLSFAIQFALHMSDFIAEGLRPNFRDVKFGEKPSQAVTGLKRLDISYNTPQAGLGLGISLKSVHFGEENDGAADFVHNKKRNDEELRVEATGHHLRQPFAVLVAVLVLPFEACFDVRPEPRGQPQQTPASRTSSFADWVEYLWPLKGRDEPDDPPDRFELVFIGLYSPPARLATETIEGAELGFFHLNVNETCPRWGRPRTLLTFAKFLDVIKATYDVRNGKDFRFAKIESDSPKE